MGEGGREGGREEGGGGRKGERRKVEVNGHWEREGATDSMDERINVYGLSNRNKGGRGGEEEEREMGSINNRMAE